MKRTETQHQIIPSGNLTIGLFFLGLFLAMLLVFGFFMRPAARSAGPVSHGLVQETIGYWIQVLERFDQERRTRLQERRNFLVSQISAFEAGREERLQEILGQSIAHRTRMILTEQSRLGSSINAVRDELRQVKEERSAWRQEQLGKAVLAAYRQAPSGGAAFREAFQQEATRLKRIAERKAESLESRLLYLTAQEMRFRDEIPMMVQEAIQSAHRSARMLDESQAAWTQPILDELKAELSWRRQPEDYILLAGTVREILKGNDVASGFAEYGLPSLTGLLLAMVWVGLTIPRYSAADDAAASGEPVVGSSQRKAA